MKQALLEAVMMFYLILLAGQVYSLVYARDAAFMYHQTKAEHYQPYPITAWPEYHEYQSWI